MAIRYCPSVFVPGGAADVREIPMTIKVLLVDDHQMVRSGLKALIQAEPGMQVVGEADNGRLGMALAKEHSPDVVVMDLCMPDLNGIDATRQILAQNGASA